MTLAGCFLLVLMQVGQDSETDRLKKEIERLKAEQAAVRRDLEAAQALVKKLTEGSADLRASEEKHVEMARARKHAEQLAADLAAEEARRRRPAGGNVPPTPPPTAKPAEPAP